MLSRSLRILLAVLVVSGLAACGSDDDEPLRPSPRLANDAVTRLLTSVDAIGTGAAGLLSSDPRYADLQLRANRAGATVQLRFSCTGCSLTVRAGTATAGANQYLSVPFADLEDTSDVPVTVTDNVSNAVATYTLRAQPLDRAPLRIGANNTPQPGDLYLTPFDPDGRGAHFAYLVGNDGRLKYYYRNRGGQDILDFKKTVIPGGLVRYSFYDGAAQAIRVMDADFATLALVQARPFPDGNTYAIDGHDHVIVDDGHYIVGVYAAKTVANIPSQPGRSLFVTGTGLQEIVGGAATFSWLSTDQPTLYACSARGNGFAANNGADYAHWNALAVDNDGNWLATFRHLDAVLKINRTSGNVDWILGGACDQFDLDATQRFTSPHDARRAPDGRLTLFDIAAGNNPSRVLAFNLDEAGRTVSTFAPFTTDAHFSYNLGSAQSFASGRMLVGWGEFVGATSDVSEYDINTGTVHFQLTLLPSPYTWGYFSYRARKYL